MRRSSRAALLVSLSLLGAECSHRDQQTAEHDKSTNIEAPHSPMLTLPVSFTLNKQSFTIVPDPKGTIEVGGFNRGAVENTFFAAGKMREEHDFAPSTAQDYVIEKSRICLSEAAPEKSSRNGKSCWFLVRDTNGYYDLSDLKSTIGLGRHVIQTTRGTLQEPADPVIIEPGRLIAHPAMSFQPVFAQVPYPAMAMQKKAQGRVVALLDIGGDGRVSRCTVKVSSGSTVLDNATCLSAKQFGRFTPAQDQYGQPIASTYTLPVYWALPPSSR